MKPRINLNQNIHLLSTTHTHVLEEEQSSVTFQSFSNVRFTMCGSMDLNNSLLCMCDLLSYDTTNLSTQNFAESACENHTKHHMARSQNSPIHPSQKKKKKSTRFHGNDNQTQMVWGCITFGTHPETYTKRGRSRTYLKDCF